MTFRAVPWDSDWKLGTFERAGSAHTRVRKTSEDELRVVRRQKSRMSFERQNERHHSISSIAMIEFL